MKWNEVFRQTFKALSEELNLPPEGRSMVDNCWADDSELCLEAVANGWLTEEQMRHAAERYHLGKSRQGKTIYWMIDERGLCHDGHVGNTWISEILKRRYPEAAQYIRATHTLFGQHLLCLAESAESAERWALPIGCAEKNPYNPLFIKNCVSIVESERSAVLLSELYPQNVWLATVYPANFTVDQLAPLRGYRVTLFPRTDPVMDHYVAWLEIADQARRLYHLDISVSSILEDNATEDQKSRCIDLLEFLFN